MHTGMSVTTAQVFVIRNNLMQTVMGLGMCVIQHQAVGDVDNRSVSSRAQVE